MPRWSRRAGTTCKSRRCPIQRTSASTSCTCATSASTTRPCRTTYKGTFMAFTLPDSNGMQHLQGAAAGRPEPPAPAAGLRHRHHQREQERVAVAHLRRVGAIRPGRRGAAGAGVGHGRPGRLQLGLRSVALHHARRQLRHRSRRRDPHPRVPRDGQGAQRDRPAGGDGRGLQPHQLLRPEPEVGAGPHRARLLPPPGRQGRRGDQHLLPEHRHRAHHDGEADGRLGRYLGDGLQGRRLPLRPDGPSHEEQHARSCATAWTA